MRKYLLFLLCLCVHGMARGQTGFDYRYWYDNDESKVLTGHSDTGQWQMDIDLAGLSEALHAVHIQVIDSKGNMSSPVTRHFLKLRSRNVREGYYWFETDSKARKLMGQIQGAFQIDVTALPQGFHTIYFQMVGEDGTLSSVTSRSFYKVTVPKSLNYRCWVDDDLSTLVTGKHTGAPILIDLTDVTEGFHVLRTQIEGSTLSSVVSRPFMKLPQVDGMEYMRCICSVDNQPFLEENVPAAGGIVHWNFDVSTLPYGFHRIQVKVMMPTGAATSTYDSFFLRIPTTQEMNDLKCVYAIDGAEYHTEAGSMNDGVFHCDLDVAHLSDGLHRIVYKLSNGKGVETKTQTQFFVKTPVGGNGIVEYQYWLNDSVDQVSRVRLDHPVTPYQLVTMLPLPKHPIHSSLFQFEIDGGKPVVYARNNIHIRFFDASERFTDVSAEFVDYSVRQEVTDIERLISGVRATTPKPVGDDIKWYQLDAEPGDSLRFKLDRAATIQLYSPSGKEVHNVSGYESVEWSGVHVNESGTYYVALHDVTARQGTEINIDYLHIDKYAVLRQDVRLVGNGGFNTITFEGNGFNELRSIDLVGRNTLTAVEIGHESNGMSSVKFDFDGARIGTYKAVFHFAGKDIIVEDCIIVEPAREFDIDVKASFASAYLFSTGNNYTFKVHNNSNMTAYNIPMVVLIYVPDSSALMRVRIDGFSLRSYYESLLGGHYTNSVNKTITEKENISGDKCYFLGEDSTTHIAGLPYLYYTFIHETLPPYSSKTINVKVETSDKVNVYLHYPDEWPEPDSERHNSIRKKQSKENSPDCQIAQNRIASCHEARVAEREGIDEAGMYFTKEYCNNIKIPKGCPPFPRGGGPSYPVRSFDPNDIFGYLAESGNKAVRDSLYDVNYTIEFENDAEFATAPAHDIYLTDTLDTHKFDLSTYMPTRIKIGKKSMELSGEKDFVTTMDMRPEINCIAQIEGSLDMNTGIVKLHISSLDPETMEPTTYIGDGVLPVNGATGSFIWDDDDEQSDNRAKGFMWEIEDDMYERGIGEMSFNISLRSTLAHGTEVPNRVGIVFDKNDVIMTPTWTNVIDHITPESSVIGVELLNDSTASVSIEANDDGSGPWRYDVYVQYGEGSGWWKAAENVPIDTTASVKVYDGINHGFYVLVTDSAGNMEKKEPVREFVLDMSDPDAIEIAEFNSADDDSAIYDLQGRRIERASIPKKGIYIVTGRRSKAQKVMRH